MLIPKEAIDALLKSPELTARLLEELALTRQAIESNTEAIYFLEQRLRQG